MAELKREMDKFSSILAERILWTEEPGVLQSMGLQRIRQDLVTEPQLGFTACIFNHSILSSNNYRTSSIM